MNLMLKTVWGETEGLMLLFWSALFVEVGRWEASSFNQVWGMLSESKISSLCFWC